MKVILGPASKQLGERISTLSGFGNIGVASKVFPDGESYVRLEGEMKGENVAIVQTTCPPMQDGKLFQLAFMADAA
ncbi:MAG: ribose-phosphate pyrophosphokinase-like domain-containing protein, partial [Candidatus Bathyarchaeia archaeon]